MPDRQLDLDRDRVTVLLLINALLIKKAYNIYVTVLSNQQVIQRMLHQARQGVLDQYNNLNRRLQCNLGVLSYINDVYHNKTAAQQPNRLQFPVILSAPAEMPELKLLYKQLYDLYPEAIQYLKMKIQQIKQQQPEEFQRRQMEKMGMQRPGQKQQPMSQLQQKQQQQQQQLQQQQQQQQLQQQLQQQQQQQHQQQQQQLQLQQSQQLQPQLQLQQQQQQQPQPQPQLQQQLQQQQQFSQFAVQLYNSPQMGMRNTGGQYQGVKSMSPDTMFKENGDFDDFAGGKNAPMLISPQQILQQQGGNSDFSLGLF